MNIHELVENVEYKCGDSIYRIAIDGFFEVKNCNDEWTESYVPYNTAIGMEFKECEFEPKVGERYYYPNFENTEPWELREYRNNAFHNRIKRNVGVYRTKEQAIEKAKELGWVE